MRVGIEGVGHRNNTSLYDLEDSCEEFITEVKRALYKLEHEDGDLKVKVVCNLDIKLEKPVEAIKEND